METKERYGRFVLQFEDARTSAGSFFRAVQLGDSGYEKHVQLFRSEMLAQDLAQAVADGLSNGLLVQHAQVARAFEAGRIDRTAFAACEMLEGRSVGALMERSKSEGHPFAADHALLIASKAAAALESAQGKKQTHGFLIPEFIHVSHDGEVSVRGFGLPPRLLRSANCVGVREATFLAPEVDAATPLDIRADIFSLGAQLIEMLTGSALPRDQPVEKSIQAARIPSPGTDGTPIPKALTSVLLQALAEDPARRFKDATVFKKAVDTLLFSGDYSPTTFNLAFFMHTLFRDEGDQDAATIKAERGADYRPYLALASAGAGVPTSAPRPSASSPSISASGIAHAPSPSAPAPAPRAQDSTSRMDAIRPELFKAESAKADPPKSDSGRSARVPTPTGPFSPGPVDESPSQTVRAEKKSFPVAPVVLGVLAVLGAAAYFVTRSGSAPVAPPASPTMNAAESAALARVRELEARLAAFEAEKVAAGEKATEEATKKVEAQAKARGRAVDPAELQKAQDDARRKAQAEQEARLQAERQKIEEERRRAEEVRAAEAAKAAEAAALASAAPSMSPAFVAAPPVAVTSIPSPVAPAAAATPAVAAVAGTVAPSASSGPLPLDLSDPGVTPPQLVSQSKIPYPPVALAQRITGSVVISALIDEQGNVAEARVIRGASPNSGLNQAALENVKNRKYKPATSNGKPGRAWIAVQIDFKL